MPSLPAARLVLALIPPLAVAACGGDDSGAEPGGDSGPTADAGAEDGGGACSAWQLMPSGSAVDSLTVDPGPFNTEKTVRVLVDTALTDCERPAIPVVTVSEESATVSIGPLVWRQVAGDCVDRASDLIRPVPLRLGRAATWTVIAGDQSISIDVGPAPDRACGGAAGSPCEMDCDCGDEGEGLRCLSGSGLAGPFTECARSCELDRDCGGSGVCLVVPDGLAFACTGDTECTDEVGCPDGWRCEAGACQPEFTLSASTRVECSCDADCDTPLRCVKGSDGGGRCEVPCESSGPWCEGAHTCGQANMDLAGLAESDSVCVFLGE